MKYEFCDECVFSKENLPEVCDSCDEGDQFDPLFDDDEDEDMKMTVGEEEESQYPIWKIRQAA